MNQQQDQPQDSQNQPQDQPQDQQQEQPLEQPVATGLTAALSLRLPPFWPADPALWFAQVEAQFRTKNITIEKTKYEYVVASLSPEHASEVRDIILHTPSHQPYQKLKATLVERTTASEQQRLRQLFQMEELGDRTPSQFFRRMQQLLGDKAADTDSSFIRELFLQRLPSNTRMVLASAGDDLPLDKLAALADKIYEVTATTPQTPSTFSPPVCKVTASDQLVTELSHLRDEVSHLKQLLSLQNGSRYPRRRSPSPVPRRSRDEHQAICWYHQKFGASARKCQPPCTHSLPLTHTPNAHTITPQENSQASR